MVTWFLNNIISKASFTGHRSRLSLITSLSDSSSVFVPVKLLVQNTISLAMAIIVLMIPEELHSDVVRIDPISLSSQDI